MKSDHPTPEPSKLLEAFLVSDRSERAFAALVGSLDRLVHSAALRRTGQIQLAEEVSQNVFAILARKASALRHHPCLEAWAMETTRLEARTVLRSERRRQRKIAALSRETEAQFPTPPESMDRSEDWQEALPILDDALERLPMKDRRLILERFYKERKFREIAATTGESEGACKKRLKRALDKLAGLLAARGVTLSVTAVASVLGTELARSAPSQTAALIAPKALAAASSVSTTTLLTNTLLTMNSTKTTALTVPAVIALAAIPITWQRMETSKIQEQLARYDSPAARPLSNSRAAGSETSPSRGTSGDRLTAAARPASASRTLLLDLCSSDQSVIEAAIDRVALMSDEERAALLEDIWRFPCTNSTRRNMVNFLMNRIAGRPPDKMFDVLIAEGQYQAYALELEQPTDNPLTHWAEKDPAAAMQWFERKLANGEFFGGLSDSQYQTVYLHLMPGVIWGDPARALDLYSRPPADIRNAKSGMYWPLKELSEAFAEELVDTGKMENINKLLNQTEGEAREVVVSQVSRHFADAGRQAEGQAFAEHHLPKSNESPFNPPGQ